jgi:hypothetical protein
MDIGRTFSHSDSIWNSSMIYATALLVKELPMPLFNRAIMIIRTVNNFFLCIFIRPWSPAAVVISAVQNLLLTSYSGL